MYVSDMLPIITSKMLMPSVIGITCYLEVGSRKNLLALRRCLIRCRSVFGVMIIEEA